MRMSSLVGRQLKESPRDAQTASHILLVRGGFIRPVSAGIYSLLPLGRRVAAKVERILREEMDSVDGQECLMPVVLPGELWAESGRLETVGDELLRFRDRNDKDMLLGMTHEEAVVALARTEVTSYKQLPVLLYQIQTKYRDEARPRAGLIRVREFTMKDGYSFHASQECLETTYEAVHGAYTRFFHRIGLKQVRAIQSDTGMMGGKMAHEFMAISEIGEDTIFVSEDGSYQANREVAVSGLTFEKGPLPPAPEEVATPDCKTIEEVAAFLGVDVERTAKAVLFRHADGRLIFAVVRGDFEVNEAKLKRVTGSVSLDPAPEDLIRSAGVEPGYASPLGVDAERVVVVLDHSAAGSTDLVTGANREGFHLRHVDLERELADAWEQVVVADIASARAGDPSPTTGSPLLEERGIEVGNIFQLGTRYSEAMGGTFLNEQGKATPYVMGCYGIGVGRAFAAVVEQAHDDRGPIWPISIAPFEVHVVALNYNKELVQQAADSLVDSLRAQGLEVLFDDRNRKAGFAFADADLVGAPFRVVIAPRGLADGEVEVGSRDGQIERRVRLDQAPAVLAELVREAHAALRAR